MYQTQNQPNHKNVSDTKSTQPHNVPDTKSTQPHNVSDTKSTQPQKCVRHKMYPESRHS